MDLIIIIGFLGSPDLTLGSLHGVRDESALQLEGGFLSFQDQETP